MARSWRKGWPNGQRSAFVQRSRREGWRYSLCRAANLRRGSLNCCHVTLADERRVADDSPRSNARLVREKLLHNRAAAASFTPLADVRLPADQELAAASARIANLPLPADIVILGMGDDGHTASWFPGAEGLADAMDAGARQFVAPIVAPDAPEPRLTLTGRTILRARAIALEIEGGAKLATFAAALEPGPEEAMPIRAVLRGVGDRLTVFSAKQA
jgi:6-phosphogluconolactonase